MEARGRGRRGVNLGGDVKRYERIGCPAAGNTVRAVRIRRMRTSSKPTASSLGANTLRGGGVARASGSPPTPPLFGAVVLVATGSSAPSLFGAVVSSKLLALRCLRSSERWRRGLRANAASQPFGVGGVVAVRSVARRACPSGPVAAREPGTPCVACLPFGVGVARAVWRRRPSGWWRRGSGARVLRGKRRHTSHERCVACSTLRGWAASRTRARLQADPRSSERRSPVALNGQAVATALRSGGSCRVGPVPAFAPRSAGGLGRSAPRSWHIAVNGKEDRPGREALPATGGGNPLQATQSPGMLPARNKAGPGGGGRKRQEVEKA